MSDEVPSAGPDPRRPAGVPLGGRDASAAADPPAGQPHAAAGRSNKWGSDLARPRRRAAEHLAAGVLFAGTALLLFGPRILGGMTTRLLSASTQDGSIFVWMFRWWPYAIAHHLNPWFTTVAWAPGGINLAWSTSVPAPAVAMAPLTQALGPLFSYNAVQLAAPVLAAWTGYLLCRRIVGSFAPAVLGGLCFGFSPSLIDEFGQGHPNLSLVFLIPVAAYLTLRLLEGSIRSRWLVCLLGIVLALQIYVSTEVAATLTLMGALFGVAGYALGEPGWRPRLRRAIGPVCAAYAVALVLALPLLYAAFTRLRPYKPIYFRTIGQGASGRGDLLRYVIPGRFTILGDQFGQRWGPYGNPWYFGIPLLVLLILFVITERHRRRTWALAAGLLLTLVLSTGDMLAVAGAHVLPWRLFALLPLLNRAQPGRLVSYAFLIAAVMVAIWLARPGRRPVRWAAAALAALTILPNVGSNVWVRQVPMPRLLASGAYRRYLVRGETVWLVDPYHNRPMIWQAETGFAFRTAGGFFGVTPPGLPDADAQARLGLGSPQGISAPDIRTFLTSHRVGTVLMAEEPPGVVRAMAGITGVAGIQLGGMVVFQLGTRFR